MTRARERRLARRERNLAEAQSATMEVVEAQLGCIAEGETRRRFRFAFRHEAGRIAIFNRLVKLYEEETGSDVDVQLEDGDFWERFLEFLANIDWDKVFEMIMKLIELIVGLFASEAE